MTRYRHSINRTIRSLVDICIVFGFFDDFKIENVDDVEDFSTGLAFGIAVASVFSEGGKDCLFLPI